MDLCTRILKEIDPRSAAVALLLSFQVVMIFWARFSPMRFFCWAPHDYQNDDQIEVVLDGKKLTNDAVERRYRMRAVGINPRAIEHVFHAVQQYEESYGRSARASVVVKYRTNGGPVGQWRWDPR